MNFVDDDVLQLDRTAECFDKIVDDPDLSYSLAPKKSLPGTQLRHVYNFVEKLVVKEAPLIFKLGYTHDAVSRFRNRKYGYAMDKFHRWAKMVVLFAGVDSTAAAYIEAAAIQKFKSTMADQQQLICYVASRLFKLSGYLLCPNFLDIA